MIYLPIYKTLKADAAVKAIFGDNLRIYEDIAPIGTSTPYAVWQEVGGNAENSLDCPAKTDHIMYRQWYMTLTKNVLMKVVNQSEKH